MTLDPHLSVRDLRADRRLGVLGEVRVPEGVVADLVAVTRQELELLTFEGRLVEEPVGRARARQHIEGAASTEIRMLLEECLEDADTTLGVDLGRAVLLEV